MVRFARTQSVFALTALALVPFFAPLGCSGAQRSTSPSRSTPTEPSTSVEEPPPLPIDDKELAATAAKINAAPVDTWSWVDIPAARCGNGKQTGLGINRAASSNVLLIFMQGGGACSDATSCYARNMATYVASGYDANQFTADRALLDTFVLTNRTSPGNPLANAHLAYIPYCTGDVHTGNNVITYPGAPQTTFHVGAIKTQLSAAVLAAAFESVERVVLAGSSAGAFGVVVNYGLVQSYFPTNRVDVISDSGENPISPPSSPTWASLMPTRCATCDHNHFGSYLPAYARAYPSSRFAALSFEIDTVLPTYLGMPAATFAQSIKSYFGDINQKSNARTFVAPGSNHVVLNRPGIATSSQTLTAFLTSMLHDDPSWRSAP